MNTTLINLDWLSFSVILAFTEEERIFNHAQLNEPPGIKLVECDSGTPQYRRRVLVISEKGDKLLTLLLEPHAKIIHPQSMFVEVANANLYDTMGVDWLLDLIENIHQYSFQSLSRIDIAADFLPTTEQWDIITSLAAGTAYVQGKKDGAMFHIFERPGGKVVRMPKQMGWGSKYSAIKWKLYNKTKEITEIDDKGRTWVTKPYIVDAWTDAGLPTDGDKWRLEMSLTGASSYDWRGDKIGWPLTSREQFVSFFWDTYASRFTIRANEGHQCRKNDKLLPLLEIPDTTSRVRKRTGTGEQLHAEYAATLRSAIREIERPEVAANPAMMDAWIGVAASTIAHGNLGGYFYRSFGCSWEDYAASLATPQPPTPLP